MEESYARVNLSSAPRTCKTIAERSSIRLYTCYKHKYYFNVDGVRYRGSHISDSPRPSLVEGKLLVQYLTYNPGITDVDLKSGYGFSLLVGGPIFFAVFSVFGFLFGVCFQIKRARDESVKDKGRYCSLLIVYAIEFVLLFPVRILILLSMAIVLAITFYF